MIHFKFVWLLAGILLHANAAPASSPSQPAQFTPVSLTNYYNNQGIGSGASLDGMGGGFPFNLIPNGGIINVGNILYNLTMQGNDNIAVSGQSLAVTPHTYGALYILATATYGPYANNITVVYDDGSSDITSIVVPDWQSDGVYVGFQSPSIIMKHSVADVTGYMFSIPIYVNPKKNLTKVTLPGGTFNIGTSALHIFAASAVQAANDSDLSFVRAVATSSKVPDDSGKLWQMVEADVHNSGTQWARGVQVRVMGYGVKTVVPGTIEFLAPGQRQTVYIGVSTSFNGQKAVQATLAIQGHNVIHNLLSTSLVLGTVSWQSTKASIGQHKAPRWFDEDKFGIFIHWGLYSVPAWGPPGVYAEWYWYNYLQVGSPTYNYHKKVYGENFEYDSFLPMFKPDKWDPNAWLDLISDAGANYFVLTSKHHEGWALWDTKVSNRSFAAMGPKRDFVQDLLTAAKKSYPKLKAGLYFSMPEWYNAAYPPWNGFGGGPYNPYTVKGVPYTGSPSFTDYVNQLQLPQLMELTELDLDLKIIWCDIGGINNSTVWQSKFFNDAAAKNYEVTVNDRCGLNSHDFTTPEYSTLNSITPEKWEATRGIDPYSFGFNQATLPNQYANASSLIQLLVDAVSKGGNLLLDIGPDKDGVVSDPQQATLKGMGSWLGVNGEAIYNTTYWWVTSQENNLRFTYASKAFYITALDNTPSGNVTIKSPIPIAPGNTIKHLGSSCGPFQWSSTKSGTVTFAVPDNCLNTIANVTAWVFKVNWS
ncbi:hypothetical protein INT43_001414 [Umbelopsis isabellina]|uniref:alpha-L-fucosidase n=1 Tax=Mortierella isabellina TaxID=91625 RepID=A0A8H7U9P2_MORIS|nr:hypothetical protein INT43_001414 [Umbelopsis isabellina]